MQIGFPNTYPLDSYLSIKQYYQMFVQPGPSKYLSDIHVFTFNEETELIPSNSIRPHFDIQRVLRLVKEVPRSLINQINQHVSTSFDAELFSLKRYYYTTTGHNKQFSMSMTP